MVLEGDGLPVTLSLLTPASADPPRSHEADGEPNSVREMRPSRSASKVLKPWAPGPFTTEERLRAFAASVEGVTRKEPGATVSRPPAPDPELAAPGVKPVPVVPAALVRSVGELGDAGGVETRGSCGGVFGAGGRFETGLLLVAPGVAPGAGVAEPGVLCAERETARAKPPLARRTDSERGDFMMRSN